ncbi:MAG: dihydrolipoyl dehydrogenase [Chlamydiales bacterium]
MKYDLVVIGAGPGGYIAAIRAAQKGWRVACIDKSNTLGGTCLNVGCIPSKALLHSTEYFERALHGQEHGIEAEKLSIHFARLIQRKNEVVQSLTEGIAFLFKKNKIDWMQGQARFMDPHTIQAGDKSVQAERIIIASGSEPIPLPFLSFDETRVLSSTGALACKEVPKKMLIVGAGVIGLELGSVYRRLGAHVEVIELLPRVISSFDTDLSKVALQIFTKQGMHFHLSTKVLAGKVERGKVHLDIGQQTLTGDVVLVAIGRRPYTQGLELAAAGVQTNAQGQIMINGTFQTTQSNIYAIGDVVDGPMLAHKASEEGIAVVDYMANEQVKIQYLCIPNVMYTWPEVAAVGMTEEEAKKHELIPLCGKVSFKSNPRARCSGDTEGLVKIVAKKDSGHILGIHIIGPNASEMIGAGVLALENKMTLQKLAHASHAHPTCSEAIKEAALATLNQSIHN